MTVRTRPIQIEQPDGTLRTLTAADIRGEPGPPGDGWALTLPAARPLSGHRVVGVTATGRLGYAAGDMLLRPLWLTPRAADTDELITVIRGAVSEPSWAWTPRQTLYVASGGVLTATFPTVGIVRRVGQAVTADRIFFDPSEPVALAT